MSAPSLKTASDEIKLAVDLIYLLESHQIAPEVALKALAIVTDDMKAKQRNKENSKN